MSASCLHICARFEQSFWKGRETRKATHVVMKPLWTPGKPRFKLSDPLSLSLPRIRGDSSSTPRRSEELQEISSNRFSFIYSRYVLAVVLCTTLSFADTIRFLPWADSLFARQSGGYPSPYVLRQCLGWSVVKTVGLVLLTGALYRPVLCCAVPYCSFLHLIKLNSALILCSIVLLYIVLIYTAVM